MIINRDEALGHAGPPHAGVGTIPLLQLFEQLIRSRSPHEFEQTYLRSASGFVRMPMFAMYLYGPSGEVERYAGENVSDYFLARYEEVGRAIDPLLHYTTSELEPADNLMLMTAQQWRDHDLFREVLRLHTIVHGMQAPVLCEEKAVGTLNWGSDERRGAVTSVEREAAAALGRLVGLAVDVVRRQEFAETSHRQMTAALDLLPTAIAITDPHAGQRHLNASARALLDQVVDGDSWIDRLTARTGGVAPRAADAQVPLIVGGRAPLELRLYELGDDRATTISLLRLAGRTRTFVTVDLAQLTAREREIADLVSEALNDSEIAERLYLSPHTVRQHIKSIYRKLGISSRVALTRIVLTAVDDESRPALG